MEGVRVGDDVSLALNPKYFDCEPQLITILVENSVFGGFKI